MIENGCHPLLLSQHSVLQKVRGGFACDRTPGNRLAPVPALQSIGTFREFRGWKTVLF